MNHEANLLSMKKRDCEKNLFAYKFVKLAADPFLRFENGRLRRITTGEYGYSPATFASLLT